MNEGAYPGLGRRIVVIGNSCSGKSTLAEHLATSMDVPFVELDALNWLPNWVGLNATDPERLRRRIAEATEGDAWVVAGSYSEHSKATFWPRLDTMIWLDMRLPLLLKRVVVRSWQRHRNKELLWGTNHEKFWDQLAVWKGEESLIWWILKLHYDKRRRMYEDITNPRWAHINIIRLRTPAEVDTLLGN